MWSGLVGAFVSILKYFERFWRYEEEEIDGGINGKVVKKTTGEENRNRQLWDGCRNVSVESRGNRADKADERQPRKEMAE